MIYVTDINEVFRLLDETCGEPIYKDIGLDGDGTRIAVPCYAIGGKEHVSEKALVEMK